MIRFAKGWHLIVLISLLVAGMGSIGITVPAQAATLPSTLRFISIASGLTDPVFVTNAGDGSNRLFIVQQTGQIRIFKNGGLLSAPFLNISSGPGLVSNFTGGNGEQGLLALAFDPNYINNRYFYITYTTTNNDPTFKYTTTLARYRVSNQNPDQAVVSSGTVLLSIPKKYANHNGGMIAFGPDGYLYMSMGDGGSGGDPENNAQNIHTLLGKLLRLDVESTPPTGKTYVIPPTNPFYGRANPKVKQEIWAYGLRNPWRFSFDPLTGDLYIGDVGQNKEEEVDFQVSASAGGQNYGWHILEGNLCYNPSTGCVQPLDYVPPVATYDHGTNDSYGCSVTGGYVYRGTVSPSLQGVYFYGDYCSGKVLGLIKNPDNTWTSGLITSTSYLISSLGQDEQNELYLADYGAGQVYQVCSGCSIISGSAGVEGATLSYSDGTPKTATSHADGSYSFIVSSGWSSTVTPSFAGCTFSPPDQTYSNVTADITGQDYTAACSMTLKSVASNDGWVLESGENTNAGGSMDSAAASINLGDDAANRQYRGILSFNTDQLPDNAVIDSLKLRIKKSGVVGSDPFSSLGKIAVDMNMGSFSNNPALQNGDFEAVASQSNAGAFLNALVNGWYNKILPSGSFGFVNLAGTTQFRLRFQTDDNNNHVADDLQIYSGNAAANVRPQLVITYHAP